MKIICDCGNTDFFNTIYEETGEPNRYTEDEGQYTTIDKFDFWSTHYEIGIVCSKCKKRVWIFK